VNDALNEARTLRDELAAATFAWANGDRSYDAARTREVRRRAAVLNHRHYHATIPFYRKLSERAGIGAEVPSFETIVRELMMPDDIFKSYAASLLDDRDFAGMNRWVRNISAGEGEETSCSAGDIDAWIDDRAARGVQLVFSSGTSGKMSFVPRDEEAWHAFLSLPYLYIPGLLARRGVLPRSKRILLRIVSRLGTWKTVLDLAHRFALRDFDGYFLNFSGGNQGIQLVGRETAKLTGSACFLYESPMSAAAVRAIIRGPRDQRETELVDAFLETTVRQKDANYTRFISQLESSVKRRRKVMLFGTPYLFKELAERVLRSHGRLSLPRGSQATFGGGWKSLEGQRIPERELIALISRAFDLPESAILEGYSMTEINGLMLKCTSGRYHVPPVLEAMVFDESLSPMTGSDVTGILGVIDPFATSYPGFLITGDNVRLVDERCACGLSGPAILAVDRSPGREVKGCGGIMATVNA
jgi:hypothetical protein